MHRVTLAAMGMIVACQISWPVEQPLAGRDVGADAGLDAGIDKDAGLDGGSADGGPVDAGFCPGTPCVCNGYELCNWGGTYQCVVDDLWTHTVVPADTPLDSQYVTFCPELPSRFHPPSECSVTDQITGLTWQQTTAIDGYTSAQAEIYCAGLNYGGFTSGWRLPTIVELSSIAVYGEHPAMNHSAFPNAPAAGFWSSTASPLPGTNWFVNFEYGSVSDQTRYHFLRVRCVR